MLSLSNTLNISSIAKATQSPVQKIINAFNTRVLAAGGVFRGKACLNAQLTTLSDLDLLDDASIVITPNAVKAGTLFAVIPVPSDGAEQVVDGSFANDLDDWSDYGTTSATGGIATIGASSNSGMFQDILTEGVRYTTIINVTSYDGVGNAQVVNNDGTLLYTITTAGIQTFTFIHSIANANILIRGTSNALFSLSSVSVKEYTSADMDFTRATTTTEEGEDELIADVAVNVPRINFVNGCPVISANPQRTNLVTYSEVYGDGTFFSATNGSTIVNTTSISPSGDANATQLISTGAGKLQSAGVSLTQNTDYTLSFYAKNVDATEVKSRVLTTGGSGGSNLTSVSYISELSTTEWTRITHTFNTGTWTTFYLFLANALNSGETIQLSDAQLELGSYATSYIPTNGGTVTRNQETFTRDGISSLINDDEGVLFVEIAALSNDGTFRQLTLSDGTTGNRILLDFTDVSNRIRAFCGSGGVSQVNETFNVASSLSFNKIAFKYKLNDFALWINGVEVATDTSGSVPTGLNKLAFDNGEGSFDFYGKVKQLQVYQTALTDTQLAALTT
jgi:hypothetical protein